MTTEANLSRPIRLRWYCLKCAREHEDFMPLEEALSAAQTHFGEGSPFVLLTDVARHEMLKQDGLEAALRNPLTLGEHLEAERIAAAAQGVLNKVFKPSKST